MASKALDTLWYTRCPVPTGLGIAVQKGWLQESLQTQRVKLGSLRESNDRAVRESHFDHTLDNSVRHGGSIPAIWARSSGRETRLLGLSWVDEAQLILTLPGSGIHSPKDLRGRRFGLPRWVNVQIDFARAQALRGLENALSVAGLHLSDLELVDFAIAAGYSDAPAQNTAGGSLFSGTGSGAGNPELVSLLRGEVDAIFLKGASAAQLAHQFGLAAVFDIGSHPDPLLRSNNGTPRTLTVDRNLVDNYFDAAVQVVAEVLRAESWAHDHPDETRRYLARETNSSEYWVSIAYGEDAHTRLRTELSERSVLALQDLTSFLYRHKFIPRIFDVRDWIEARPLQVARHAAADTPNRD